MLCNCIRSLTPNRHDHGLHAVDQYWDPGERWQDLRVRKWPIYHYYYYNAESPDNFSSKMINNNNDILIVLLVGSRHSQIPQDTPHSLQSWNHSLRSGEWIIQTRISRSLLCRFWVGGRHEVSTTESIIHIKHHWS